MCFFVQIETYVVFFPLFCSKEKRFDHIINLMHPYTPPPPQKNNLIDPKLLDPQLKDLNFNNYI